MVQIKRPAVYDISHWVPVNDFRALDPLPWLIITKATEGEYFLDATYGDYAERIPEAGIRLGAFHFMRPGDEVKQANWFCEILLDVGLMGDEVLACDLEVNGVSLLQVKNFLDRTQAKTGIRPIIYSTQLQIEDLYPNGICPAWLKDEWIWPAEYPNGGLDVIHSIPGWVVPRELTVNNIALWQYSDDGIVGGIDGNNVDLNMINPLYAQAIGLTEPNPGGNPMPEPITHYYEVTSAIASEYRTIRSNHVLNAAEVGRLAVGTKAKATVNDVFVYTDDVFSGSTPLAKKGDRWVHIFENNGKLINGWIAEIHLGVRKTNLVEIGAPPPVDDTLITVDVILHDVITQGDRYAARGVVAKKEV
ncbi:MAG: glycoside hydrolase family 25 protein [Anaerolineae bacterium]|nr:glycoside hydrolase family 25 protein [Anaerolineae bacterium]